MAARQHAHRGRRARGSDRRGLWPFAALVAIALLALGGLLWLGVSRSPPLDLDAGRDNVLGDPNAPVTVEDWSDFQ